MKDSKLSRSFDPVLTPSGRITLSPSVDAESVDVYLSDSLESAFSSGNGAGLLALARTVGTPLPPTLAYWREFAIRYLSGACSLTDADFVSDSPTLDPPDFFETILSAPPMTGGEFLSVKRLDALWGEVGDAFAAGYRESGLELKGYLGSFGSEWHLVGKVHFNLAENKNDESNPFAFLATYTHALGPGGKPLHRPLGDALKLFAGAENKLQLISLLEPVRTASETCEWVKRLVDTGEIFRPIRWSPNEAHRFFLDMPAIEKSGVILRLPASWVRKRPERPMVQVTIGKDGPAGVGLGSLLDFELSVVLGGERLTKKEIAEILRKGEGLALVRGQWIEVDAERLEALMGRYGGKDGLTFAEAMRLGTKLDTDMQADGWALFVAGPWLRDALALLRDPTRAVAHNDDWGIAGTLRPYQQAGAAWLDFITTLGLGGCLADDMGLGKTIQVISLLTALAKRDGERRPSLVVAPATLMANWKAEIARFSPKLAVRIAHPSEMGRASMASLNGESLGDLDVLITSYGTLLRLPHLADIRWRLVIADEAQAIKNPAAKQTKALKALKADARFALTGTPVENRVGDLWSIFDFINPGLLGGPKEFGEFLGTIRGGPHGFRPLRTLVGPYILRRLKTDRTVINDLPDKTEVDAYCRLTKEQAVLYSTAVDELAVALEKVGGIKRRGLVLSTLMRLKQICNHPSQWLGDGSWQEKASGKFARLREIAETIASRQEKALIFTQFRETTDPLAGFLASIFGRSGLVLHGGTPVARRREMVDRFQNDESIPFFVISLKAGGSGLNLTAASHVIHFDRWWNPAVESQATDRAYRIGQSRNVLVHRFVCTGTVEERIASMIESKKKLASEILEGGAELNLTEMSDEELIKTVALDLKSALKEE